MLNEKTKLMVRKILIFVIEIILVALILLLATKIFKGFYIRNFGYACLASLLLILLNITIKPVLKYVMLPLNIVTLGFFTPLMDVFILKIIGVIIQHNFVIEGWISAFFVAIFVSFMTFIVDQIMGKGWI